MARFGTSAPAPRLIVLSGAAGAGKTTLGEALVKGSGSLLSARSLLLARAGRFDLDRQQLQAFGASVERQTHGRWLADALPPVASGTPTPIVVDGAETRAQLLGLRSHATVTPCHIHLEAAREERRRRFAARGGRRDAESAFAEASPHELEGAISLLAVDANLSIDTTRLGEAAVVAVAQAYLREWTPEG